MNNLNDTKMIKYFNEAMNLSVTINNKKIEHDICRGDISKQGVRKFKIALAR